MKWIELAIKTTHEEADLAANILYDAGVNGVVIEDPEEIRMLMEQAKGRECIDSALVNDSEDEVIVKGYLPEDEGLHDRLEMVRDSLKELSLRQGDSGRFKLTTGEVEEEDWAEGWKKYYKPLRIGENIVIKPTWEEYSSGERDIVIELDPGMAFGTGTHETTALCIQLLEKYTQPGSRVLDIGCGSGILSIVAAKLGAAQVFAYDIERKPVEIATKNAELNGVEHIVRVEQGDLFERVQGVADIIVANIITDVILKMSRTVKNYLQPGGVFIASGIIRERLEEVEETLLENDMEIVERITLNEWGAMAAKVRG